MDMVRVDHSNRGTVDVVDALTGMGYAPKGSVSACFQVGRASGRGRLVAWEVGSTCTAIHASIHYGVLLYCGDFEKSLNKGYKRRQSVLFKQKQII